MRQMLKAWLILVTVALLTWPFLFPVTTLADDPGSVADHVVISEFTTRGSESAYDEFVELYNPTNSEKDIGNWKLQYWTGTKWVDKLTIPANTKILSHHFYLMASSSEHFKTIPADLYHSSYLGFADGSSTDPRGVRITDSSGVVVDTVVYGGTGGGDDPDNQAEGDTLAPNHGTTPNNRSVQRKASSASTADSLAPGGSEAGFGNGWDTNNNGNDFVRQIHGRDPQNSGSTPLPPIPELPTIILFSAGLIALATFLVLKRRNREVKAIESHPSP